MCGGAAVCGGSVDETRCAATTPTPTPPPTPPPSFFFFNDAAAFLPPLEFLELLIQRAPLVQSLVRRGIPRIPRGGRRRDIRGARDRGWIVQALLGFARLRGLRPGREGRTRKIGRTRGGQNRISFAFLALLAAQRLLQLLIQRAPLVIRHRTRGRARASARRGRRRARSRVAVCGAKRSLIHPSSRTSQCQKYVTRH